jgi:hypothetical protein
MALTALPDKTVLVKLGNVREFSDVHGRHDVRIGHDVGAALEDIAARLETVFGPLERGVGWDDVTKFEAAMQLTPGIDRQAETEQDDEAISDLIDDTRRWIHDRHRELGIEMKKISNMHASAGGPYSGAHVAGLAAARSRALHQYRDEITAKRRKYRDLVRGVPDPTRFELDDNSRAILAEWRSDVQLAGMTNAPVDDVTALEGEESIRLFEQVGDPPPDQNAA